MNDSIMTTSSAAKLWDCTASWVRERCREGMIPLAEKSLRWEIPAEATKPPCTRKYAVELLKRIRSNERMPTKLLPDDSSHKREAAYHYLVEWGFLSIPDHSMGTDIAEQLHHAKVTDLGMELIERDAKETTAKSNKSISINAGVVSATYGVTQPSNKY